MKTAKRPAKTAKKPAKPAKTAKKPARKPAKRPMRPAKGHPIFGMAVSRVHPLYVQKVEKKGRTRQEVDEVICWLTGYTPAALKEQLERGASFEAFFAEAPRLHPDAWKITGTICGVRLAEIEDPLMRNIRYMDKLVDELAQGRPMEKVLRR